ncbi:DUF3472 domain-containing protein [Nocardia sp. NPDC051570]|uniref:DUF3472 domain-containing protein n=1 Tax=Nocardia sp. NPDC051570 TaxID=3364324 RepID=UPI0037973323
MRGESQHTSANIWQMNSSRGMRRFSPALFCVLLAVACGQSTHSAEAAPPEPTTARDPNAPPDDNDTGATPGTYADWNAPGEVTSFTMPMTLQVDPGNYNAYWSTQFNFDDSAQTVAYIGFQTHNDGGGMFLGSLWNATGAAPGPAGVHCEDFGGEGVGKSCRLTTRPVAGHLYLLSVTKAAGNGWTFTVEDRTAGTTTILGTIQAPADAHISPTSFNSWTEYFDWNNSATTCSQAKYSKLLFGIPTTNAGDGHYTGTDYRKRCPTMERVTLGPDGATQEDGPLP